MKTFSASNPNKIWCSCHSLWFSSDSGDSIIRSCRFVSPTPLLKHVLNTLHDSRSSFPTSNLDLVESSDHFYKTSSLFLHLTETIFIQLSVTRTFITSTSNWTKWLHFLPSGYRNTSCGMMRSISDCFTLSVAGVDWRGQGWDAFTQ